MLFYGADFSGAKDPSRRIYYVVGEATSGKIIIQDLIHCDDRLDLFAAVNSTAAPWGIDFPFALPMDAYRALGLKDWQALMDFIATQEREEFLALLERHIVPQESNCAKHSVCCRLADAAIGSFSPFKKYNPNMQAMIYGGLKLLSYLRRFGNNIYPFDKPDKSRSRVYEVYPSHVWKTLGLKRSGDLEKFAKKFNEKIGVEVIIPENLHKVGSLDASDAVVACVTMGQTLLRSGIDYDWDTIPPWVSLREWEIRLWEGLIIRLW